MGGVMSKRITAVPPAPTLPCELVAKLAKNCDLFAIEQLADFEGPSIFNPLIGHTPAKTFSNLENALGAMSAVIAQGQEIDATSLCRVLQVMTDCMWSAAQYEAFRAERGSHEQG
jgi:hypothetical protein